MPNYETITNKDQQVVLITGCTDGGIGCYLAKNFVSKGFIVCATSRNISSMDSLKSSCHLFEMDVTDPKSIETCTDTILAKHKTIDLLINNAGLSVACPLVDVVEEVINKTLQTNVFGLLRVIKQVSPIMIKNQRGTIVNIGSIAGDLCFPYSGLYAASKAAVHAMSESLRMELKPFNVNVLVIKPGAVKSNIGINNLYKENVIKETSPYMPIKTIIENIVGLSQKTRKAMDTDKFAKKTTQWIIERHQRKGTVIQHLKSPLYAIIYIIAKLISSVSKAQSSLSYFDDNHWNESHILYLGGYSIFAKYLYVIPTIFKELFLWIFFRVGALKAESRNNKKE